ncbi:MAG: saccharopine dehydrogenase C-terminal domain-containing protein [Candidatus Thermoplasmatota archaeon]|nr:saccharopine dehydrogenase C-terminal domain-containing protein [Candidatus Thermoplasmatota archaeon]MDI6887343.1 saccharopine dehydrogenase C-terminal domain-containing protein [Candidatus Thermoplasmatota archaeon]
MQIQFIPAMARTVCLPVAIGAKLILKRKLKLTGVHIPVLPVIYNPILEELERLVIAFKNESALC